MSRLHSGVWLRSSLFSHSYPVQTTVVLLALLSDRVGERGSYVELGRKSPAYCHSLDMTLAKGVKVRGFCWKICRFQPVGDLAATAADFPSAPALSGCLPDGCSGLQPHEIIQPDTVREFVVSDVFHDGEVLVSLADFEVSITATAAVPCTPVPEHSRQSDFGTGSQGCPLEGSHDKHHSLRITRTQSKALPSVQLACMHTVHKMLLSFHKLLTGVCALEAAAAVPRGRGCCASNMPAEPVKWQHHQRYGHQWFSPKAFHGPGMQHAEHLILCRPSRV